MSRHKWVETQIEPWKGHGFVNRSNGLPTASFSSRIYFEIKDDVVSCDYNTEYHGFAVRAQAYHFFFNNIIAAGFKIPDICFIVDVGDEAEDSVDTPVFTFQRRVGQKNILLPDVEFIDNSFYDNGLRWGFPDCSFEEKICAACFSGSTTGGGHITVEKLRGKEVPRIEAYRFFQDQKNVEFMLPNIVQATDDAEALLRLEGCGGVGMSWPEQLAYKFVISMDGNGATCSRVYLTLLSNSVLLKYDSDNELFYFPSLEAGIHYLPLSKHEDVIGIVADEIAQPGLFEGVAMRGRIFAERYLSRGSLMAYTADLLAAYADAA